MKKKFLSLLVAVCATIIAQANVVTGACGDHLNYSYDTETATLTITGTGDMWDWDYNSDYAPWNNAKSSIQTVVISQGVTSIGNYAFRKCKNLSSLSIANSVTSIGEYAFYYCYNLESVSIPNLVTSIGNYAFYYCENLESVSLGNSVNEIGNCAFEFCSALQSITIPNTVTSIGYEAFYGCSILAAVYMTNSSPCSISTYSFPTNSQIYVPCSGESAYRTSWSNYASQIFAPLDYELTLTDDGGGKAKITNTLCSTNTVTFEATANQYYTFKQWSDGNTDNPRTLSLTSNKSLEAQFELDPNFCKVTIQTHGGSDSKVYCSSYVYDEWGNTSSIGGDYYESRDTILTFFAYKGSECTFRTDGICSIGPDCPIFVQWSDGNTDIERTITVNANITLTAEWREQQRYTVTLQGSCLTGTYYDYWGSEQNFYCEQYTYISVNDYMHTITLSENGSCGEWLGWSDGVTDNSRTIYVTSDTTITSLFDVATYNYSVTAGTGGYLVNSEYEYEYAEPTEWVGQVSSCNSFTIYAHAIADEGYYFVQWSDGYTDSYRSIYIDSDTTLVAQFAQKQQVQVLVGVAQGCSGMGSVSGSGIYYSGDDATISATPNEGYHFVEWSDGDASASRDIYLTDNLTLFATFAAGDYGGKCGDNLYWTYNSNTQALVITGSGDMWNDAYYSWVDYNSSIASVSLPAGLTHIGNYAFEYTNISAINIPASVTSIGMAAFAGCSNLSSFSVEVANTTYRVNNGVIYTMDGNTLVAYPAGKTDASFQFSKDVTTIGAGAFYGANNLTSLVLPATVGEIGNRAFYYCYNIEYIISYSAYPPSIEYRTFDEDIYESVPLMVPLSSIRKYKQSYGWSDFDLVYPLSGEVYTDPLTDGVTITWPINPQAQTYTIDIYKGEVFVCTLTFDANGMLQNIHFNVPARKATSGTQATNGEGTLEFTISGLEAGTEYNYTIKVSDAQGQVIETHTGSFVTNAPTAMDEVESQKSKVESQKFLRNGVLLIERNGVYYNAQGAIVE